MIPLYTGYKRIPVSSGASGSGTITTLTKKSFVVIEFIGIMPNSGNNNVTVWAGTLSGNQDNKIILAQTNHELDPQNDFLGGSKRPRTLVTPAILQAGTPINQVRSDINIVVHIFELPEDI
jgi:hypothetical protein